MQHYWSLDGVQLSRTWLTVGAFDGVHRGHLEIIKRLVAGAHGDGAQAVVLTFFPHPALVLGKRNDPFYLTPPEEKAELLGQLGVDIVITHPFNSHIAQISAQNFIETMAKHLGMVNIIVGEDFALGRGREGDLAYLQSTGTKLGFTVEAIPKVVIDKQRVASSMIRNLIQDGNVKQAAKFLGRPYSIRGKVIHGDGRGRQIGIPTANLAVWPERAIPKEGVYVCRAKIGIEAYDAVTNIGVRPTFEREPVPPRVETHILDYNNELYGARIEISFFEYLRDEMRFPGVTALVAQIETDIANAKAYLSDHPHE